MGIKLSRRYVTWPSSKVVKCVSRNQREENTIRASDIKRSEAPKLHPAFTPSFLDSCEKCAFRVWEELKLESPAVLSSADHKQPSTAADRRTRIFFLLLRSWCDQPGLILVSLVWALMMKSAGAAAFVRVWMRWCAEFETFTVQRWEATSGAFNSSFNPGRRLNLRYLTSRKYSQTFIGEFKAARLQSAVWLYSQHSE